MAYIRPHPITDNANVYLANITNVVNGHTVIAGKGINVTKTSDGLRVTATATKQKDAVTYRGDYNFNEEYFPYDLVTVDGRNAYFDQNGSPIAFSGSSPLGIGAFLCNTYIPSGTNSSTFFTAQVVPAYIAAGGAVTDNEANLYRWYQANTYYPLTASIPLSAGFTTTISGYNIQASQSFWTPLVSVPPATGMVIKGEWSGAQLYKSQNVVVISSGANMGTFGCILDTTTTGSAQAPYNGAPYWIRFPGNDTRGAFS